MIKVLSLFDGMSCGQIALHNLGIKYDYYASEIDKFAIQITQKNFPSTNQLGCVKTICAENFLDIDLMLCGSPCQGFSFASPTKLNFDHEQSKLFFVFIDLLKAIKPKWFLVENVAMKKEYLDVFTQQISDCYPEYLAEGELLPGIVKPRLLCSSLVSAQNRKRYYWCNLPNNGDPQDKKIYLKDILLDDAKEPMLSNIYGGFGENKPRTQYNKSVTICTASGGGHIPSVCLRDMLHSQKSIDYMERGNDKWMQRGDRRADRYIQTPDKEKAFTLTANFYKGVPYNYFEDTRLPKPNIRKLHPIECERLQTVPDNYTEGVSDHQRYKMLGNGWTVKIIEHLLKPIKERL